MSFSHNYIWGASGEVFFPRVEPKFKHLSITPLQFQPRTSLDKWGALVTAEIGWLKKFMVPSKGHRSGAALPWANVLPPRSCGLSPGLPLPPASVPFPGRRTPAWPQRFLAFFFVAWCGSPLPPWLPFLLWPFVLMLSPAQKGKLSWFTVTHGHTCKFPAEARAVVFLRRDMQVFKDFVSPSPSHFILVFMKCLILFLVWESKINHLPANLNNKENYPNSGDCRHFCPREQ